jgi:hypothetical protein
MRVRKKGVGGVIAHVNYARNDLFTFNVLGSYSPPLPSPNTAACWTLISSSFGSEGRRMEVNKVLKILSLKKYLQTGEGGLTRMSTLTQMLQ